MSLLLEREAAERLRLTRTTLAGMRSRGTGPEWVKLGGRVFYRSEALDTWVTSCTHTPGEGRKDAVEEGDA